LSESAVHSRTYDPVPAYQDLLDWLLTKNAQPWLSQLPEQIRAGLSFEHYGDLPAWLTMLDNTPSLRPSICDFTHSVSIGTGDDIGAADRQQLEEALRGLMPWRKGPFDLYGIHLDAEWRSDMKWDRIAHRLSPLKDRVILDIGCGNGYYLLRMLGQGAARVIGIDPTPRFVVQFELLKRLIGNPIPAHILPIRSEQLPSACALFDTVFSMGVLYHRRDPLAHLGEILQVLKPGGELVLETLVIDDNSGGLLVPKERYARMRNVWAVPSLSRLTAWIAECGYEDIELLDISVTSVAEQRQTPWMQFQSLRDFLDPQDSSKTVEGYPAPRRAALRARKPG
jgi:tRNA (mo5U34)-methyltransferase